MSALLTIGELAEQMSTTHQSAVGLVDRLEAMAMVRRAVAEEDRRRVRVTVSPKGLKLLKRLYLVHRAELQSAGPRLGAVMQKAAERIPARNGRAARATEARK